MGVVADPSVTGPVPAPSGVLVPASPTVGTDRNPSGTLMLPVNVFPVLDRTRAPWPILFRAPPPDMTPLSVRALNVAKELPLMKIDASVARLTGVGNVVAAAAF